MSGTILGGPLDEFVLAVSLLVLGAALIGCGVNVCWARLGRGRDNSERTKLW